MSLLDDLGQHLEDHGIGTVTADIFLDRQPDEPANVVILYDTAGPGSYSQLQDLRRTVQVRVRHTGYDTGYAKVWSVFNLLDKPGARCLVLPGGRRASCKAMQPPELMGQDANGRWFWVFNLEIVTSRD